MHTFGGLLGYAPWLPASPRQVPATWSLVGVVIGIYTLVVQAGGPDTLSNWFVTLGLSDRGILSGKIWQLFSYGLLHGSWSHVCLNSLLVLLIGSRIERILGSLTMVRVTTAGVVGGGCGHLLLGSGLLVGLSGGGMALLLLLTTLSPQSRMLPLAISGRSVGKGIMLAALLLALINPQLAIPGFAAIGQTLTDHGMGNWFQVSHACHLGGGATGWLYGRWLLRPRVTLDRLRRKRARRGDEPAKRRDEGGVPGL